ncbi:unnamed protein product, partial [Ectocarpus fasciculatus]
VDICYPGDPAKQAARSAQCPPYINADRERRRSLGVQPPTKGGCMIVCNHAAPWLTGTEHVVCCTPFPVLFPPVVGDSAPPASQRNTAAGQQTENPSSPAAARGSEERVR